jgi:hypothetical protein
MWLHPISAITHGFWKFTSTAGAGVVTFAFGLFGLFGVFGEVGSLFGIVGHLSHPCSPDESAVGLHSETIARPDPS